MLNKLLKWWRKKKRTTPSPRYYRHIVQGGKKEIPFWLFGVTNKNEEKLTAVNAKKTFFAKKHLVPLFIRFLKEENLFFEYIRYESAVRKRVVTINNLYSIYNFLLVFENIIRYCDFYDMRDARDAWMKIELKWHKILRKINYTPR